MKLIFVRYLRKIQDFDIIFYRINIQILLLSTAERLFNVD